MNKKIIAVAVTALTLGSAVVNPASVHAENSGGQQEMYRLYNPNSGEHFYTASTKERDHLDSIGWKDEGVGWIAPQKSGTPVYRLYNKNGGEHHYTINANERNGLVKAGWKDEGIGWYSDDNKSVPLKREYNPNKFSCNHNYTTSQKEHDHLVSVGWKDEGIAWYGIGAGSSKPANAGNTGNAGSGASGNTSTQIQTKTRIVVDKPAWDETVVDKPAWDEKVSAGYDIFICNFCKQQFTNVDDLENHTWDAHNGESYTIVPAYKTVHHDAVTHIVHHPAITHQETVQTGERIVTDGVTVKVGN